jgi:hypothetical protein
MDPLVHTKVPYSDLLKQEPGPRPAQRLTPVIPATLEVEIRRAQLENSPGRKLMRGDPISATNLGMMVCACHPSYVRSWSETGPKQNARPHLENN